MEGGHDGEAEVARPFEAGEALRVIGLGGIEVAALPVRHGHEGGGGASPVEVVLEGEGEGIVSVPHGSLDVTGGDGEKAASVGDTGGDGVEGGGIGDDEGAFRPGQQPLGIVEAGPRAFEVTHPLEGDGGVGAEHGHGADHVVGEEREPLQEPGGLMIEGVGL